MDTPCHCRSRAWSTYPAPNSDPGLDRDRDLVPDPDPNNPDPDPHPHPHPHPHPQPHPHPNPSPSPHPLTPTVDSQPSHRIWWMSLQPGCDLSGANPHTILTITRGTGSLHADATLRGIVINSAQTATAWTLLPSTLHVHIRHNRPASRHSTRQPALSHSQRLGGRRCRFRWPLPPRRAHTRAPLALRRPHRCWERGNLFLARGAPTHAAASSAHAAALTAHGSHPCVATHATAASLLHAPRARARHEPTPRYLAAFAPKNDVIDFWPCAAAPFGAAAV